MAHRQRRNARQFYVADVIEIPAWTAGVTKENTSGIDPGESEWLAS
jgi:hypothetical protein